MMISRYLRERFLFQSQNGVNISSFNDKTVSLNSCHVSLVVTKDGRYVQLHLAKDDRSDIDV